MSESLPSASLEMNPEDRERFFDDTGLSQLKAEESESVDWSEVVRLPKQPTSAEKQRLIDSAIPEKDILSGMISRQQLWNAGFVFINHIGGGEKPLLSGVIPSPEGDIDTTARTLLTEPELYAVKDYLIRTGKTLDYSDPERDELRASMLAFAHLSQQETNTLPEKKADLFKQAICQLATDNDLSGDDKKKIWQFLADKGEDSVRMKLLIDECTAGLDLSRVLGVPIDMLASRRSALFGQPSPFIDSAFHFSDNPDVTLFTNDHTKTRRLNMVTIHLLSRGLCEIGSSTNNSHDQTYITPTEFERLFMKEIHAEQDESAAPKIFCERLLARAQIWALSTKQH